MSPISELLCSPVMDRFAEPKYVRNPSTTTALMWYFPYPQQVGEQMKNLQRHTFCRSNKRTRPRLSNHRKFSMKRQILASKSVHGQTSPSLGILQAVPVNTDG